MIDLHSQAGITQLMPTTIERLWLVPARETAELSSIALPQGRTDIGSSSACDICLSISGVDAQHCSINVEGTRAVVTAHSRMTWINEGPIHESWFKPGQRLAIGPIEFLLELRTEQVVTPLPQTQLSQFNSAVENRIAQALETLQQGVDALNSDAPLPKHQPVVEMPAAPLRESFPETSDLALSLRELDRRRSLIEELQLSLNEHATSQLDFLRKQEAEQQEDRAELNQLFNELTLERTTIQDEAEALF